MVAKLSKKARLHVLTPQKSNQEKRKIKKLP